MHVAVSKSEQEEEVLAARKDSGQGQKRKIFARLRGIATVLHGEATNLLVMGIHGGMHGLIVHCAPTCTPLLPTRIRQQPNNPAAERSTRCSAQTLSRSYTGLETAGPHNGHHFLHIDDFSKEELSNMLSTARTVKERLRSNDNSYKPFEGKSMAMIFTKPSMRTRVSFETVSVCRFVLAEQHKIRMWIAAPVWHLDTAAV